MCPPTDPTDAATPADTNFAKVAAEHLRDLKAYIQSTIVSAFKGYGQVSGADCKNNAVTPDTKFDLLALAVTLFSPSNLTRVTKVNAAVLTNDIAVAGITAGGRDQVAAFSADSWVHFYWIYNPTTDTLSTISSIAAPPTGPALPTGFTHWAYAGTIRLNGSSALIKSRIKGSTVYEDERRQIANNLSDTVETALNLASYVPPIAREFSLVIDIQHDGNSSAQLKTRVVTGLDFKELRIPSNGSNFATNTAEFTYPNIGQQIYYLWSFAAAGRIADFFTGSYQVPNG